MSAPTQPHSVTIRDIATKKASAEKIVAVTAYDVLFARLVDDAGVDVVLVGDSLGNVFAGHESTLPVTLDQMIYHGAAVRRGVRRALLAVDMPFLTYQVDIASAIRNCGRVMQETGSQAVKLEGANPRVLGTVTAVVETGIPVIGHLGFTPQSVNAMGGYRVQGRDSADADSMVAAAARLSDAGAFAIVLELVPAELARRITESVPVPTIGIGAGPSCDGQVLVLPDLLGLNDSFAPRFLKRYADLAGDTRRAVAQYADEVRSGGYPGPEHSF